MENSKTILNVMNEAITELNEKGKINEGEYLEGCRILKDAYNRANDKADYIKLDKPIVIKHNNVDDIDSEYEILFAIVGYTKDSNRSVVENFVCSSYDSHEDFFFRIKSMNLENFIRIKLSVEQKELYEVESVYTESISLNSLTKSIYKRESQIDSLNGIDEYDVDSDCFRRHVITACAKIICQLITLQFNEFGLFF